MNAVPVGQFPVTQTLYDIIAVIHILSIRLLDASAYRSIVLGNGQSYERAVMELYGTLYQTLSE